jgi:hypothetical protein
LLEWVIQVQLVPKVTVAIQMVPLEQVVPREQPDLWHLLVPRVLKEIPVPQDQPGQKVILGQREFKV